MDPHPELKFEENADGKIIVTVLFNGTCSNIKDAKPSKSYPLGETLSVLREGVEKNAPELADLIKSNKLKEVNFNETTQFYVGVDGPGSGNLDHEKRIVDPGNYWDVQQKLMGRGVYENVHHAFECLQRLQAELKKQGKTIDAVNVGGWSRGGGESIYLPNMMFEDPKSILQNIPVNVFAIDPVPGVGNAHNQNCKLTPNVKEACIVIAVDEESSFFSPIFPAVMDHTKTNVKFIFMPGHHATLVGNPGWRNKNRENDFYFLEPGIITRWLAEQFLKKHGTKLSLSWDLSRVEQFLKKHGTKLSPSLDLKKEELLYLCNVMQTEVNQGKYFPLRQEVYTTRQKFGKNRKGTMGPTAWMNTELSETAMVTGYGLHSDYINNFHRYLATRATNQAHEFFDTESVISFEVQEGKIEYSNGEVQEIKFAGLDKNEEELIQKRQKLSASCVDECTDSFEHDFEIIMNGENYDEIIENEIDEKRLKDLEVEIQREEEELQEQYEKLLNEMSNYEENILSERDLEEIRKRQEERSIEVGKEVEAEYNQRLEQSKILREQEEKRKKDEEAMYEETKNQVLAIIAYYNQLYPPSFFNFLHKKQPLVKNYLQTLTSISVVPKGLAEFTKDLYSIYSKELHKDPYGHLTALLAQASAKALNLEFQGQLTIYGKHAQLSQFLPIKHLHLLPALKIQKSSIKNSWYYKFIMTSHWFDSFAFKQAAKTRFTAELQSLDSAIEALDNGGVSITHFNFSARTWKLIETNPIYQAEMRAQLLKALSAHKFIAVSPDSHRNYQVAIEEMETTKLTAEQLVSSNISNSDLAKLLELCKLTNTIINRETDPEEIKKARNALHVLLVALQYHPSLPLRKHLQSYKLIHDPNYRKQKLLQKLKAKLAEGDSWPFLEHTKKQKPLKFLINDITSANSTTFGTILEIWQNKYSNAIALHRCRFWKPMPGTKPTATQDFIASINKDKYTKTFL